MVLVWAMAAAAAAAAAPAGGGWIAFGEGGPGSGLKWLNRPAEVRTAPAGLALDRGLQLPPVQAAAVVSGSPRFRLEGTGEFVVEVFVQLVARSDADLLLRAGDRVLDGRLAAAPLRMYPGSKRLRTWALSGVAAGGEQIELASTYPEFRLVAARWQGREEFEKTLAPKLAERLEKMAADPFFEGMKSGRAPRLKELGDLALHSVQRRVRRAGLLGAARGAYWMAAENHEPRDLRLTGELLDRALAEMPDEPLIRQMASASCRGVNTGSARGMPCTAAMKKAEGVRWETADRTGVQGAPGWAAAQWRLRARMEEITRYWVEERQRANGELAGGWGDDVEILRQWGPMALGLGSAVAEKGVRRVALGVWESGMLKDGYNARIEDVEHSAEPTSDTLPLLGAIGPFDAETRNKLSVAAACAGNWIAQQPDGRWRFRSSWFNCTEHDATEGRAVDVHLNARAMGPALWHAWLSRDAKLTGLIERWGESWLAAMRSTAHGKPAGMIPAAVRAADGNYLLGATWDKPDVEWDYFQWTPGAQESLAHLFRALGDLTGRESWHSAAREAFAAVGMKPPELRVAASEGEWLARVTAGMERAEARLAVDFDMHTREAIYTDRVYYALPAELTPHLFGGGAPRGDRAPDFAVTWPVGPARFARLVTEASSSRLAARLYSFESAEAEATVRLWRLKPGAYRWTAGTRSGRFAVERLPADVVIALPARREAVLRVEPAAR